MRGVTLVIAAAGVLALSFAAGTPETGELPEVALGWPLLFHVERTGALTAILAGLVVVGWRASRGELPTRFANIEYRVEGTNATIRELQKQVTRLEFQLELRDTGRLKAMAMARKVKPMSTPHPRYWSDLSDEEKREFIEWRRRELPRADARFEEAMSRARGEYPPRTSRRRRHLWPLRGSEAG